MLRFIVILMVLFMSGVWGVDADPAKGVVTPRGASLAKSSVTPRGASSAQLCGAGDDVWNLTLGQGVNLVSVPARAATTRLLTIEDLRVKTGANFAARIVIDMTTGRTRWEAYIPGLVSPWPLQKGEGAYLLGMRSFMTAAFHSDPSVTPANQKLIAFTSDRLSPGIMKLFVMNMDGTDQRPVLANEATSGRHQLDPAWSSDGQWIYYANQETVGDFTRVSLCKVRIDGSGWTRVTNKNVDGTFSGSTTPHRLPYLTSDGQDILYTQYRTSGTQVIEGDIWRMNLVSGATVNLTPGTENSDDCAACATPSKQEVLFTSSRGGRWQVWSMLWDGGLPAQLTSESTWGWINDVRQEGNQTLFTSSVSGTTQLFLADRNCRNGYRMTSDSFSSDEGRFINGSSKVSYTSNRVGGVNKIYAFDTTDKSVVPLTAGTHTDDCPRPQP